jgi:hypothetical protein
MPLPPAHLLVGVGAADLATARTSLPRWKVWLAGGAFALLPDMDTGLGILLGRSGAFHGIFTHTPVAVLAVMLATWMVAGRRWAAATTAAYASHLVIDVMEVRQRSSVKPLWPLSEWRLESLLPLFPNVPWERGGGPWAAAFSLFDAPALPWLVAQTLVGAGLCAMLVLAARALGAQRPRGRARR